MNNAIQIEKLSLELNGTPVLNDVSFNVQSGEYVSIIGPNGAGKTTLLRCLLGMYSYRGSVRVNETECRSCDSRTLARQVSYVPQTHDIEFPLTVYDFVMMGRYPYLSALAPAQQRDEDAVERAMQITGTSSFRTRSLRTLSGGERQKVYIAAALAQETPIILLDEPSTFLDWKHQAEIMTLIRKINRECRVTVLAVNHDLNSAAHWSDRIIALKNGQVFFSGTPEKLITPERLNPLFGTEFIWKQTLAPATEQ
ncbi:MAG: ABC transporter ATP-binding protein [Kiritimatiellales bacterium]